MRFPFCLILGYEKPLLLIICLIILGLMRMVAYSPAHLFYSLQQNFEIFFSLDRVSLMVSELFWV